MKIERTCTFQSSLIDDQCLFLCVLLRSGHLQSQRMNGLYLSMWIVSYSTNNISWTFFFLFVFVCGMLLMPRGFFSSTCFNFNQILYIFVGFYLINNFDFCLTIWFYTSMCLFYWAFFSLFLFTQNRQSYTIFRFEATIVFMSLLFFSCKIINWIRICIYKIIVYIMNFSHP